MNTHEKRQKAKGKNEGSSLIKIFHSFYLLPFALFLASFVSAQGILPPKPKAKDESVPTTNYILIKEVIPDSLSVTDIKGTPRTLLSYKTATDVLVVGFFSPTCTYNQELWPKLRRFYESYNGWHVSFLGVNSNPNVSLNVLADAMSKAGLVYPAVQDEGQRVAQALHATATPEIMIIDEWGYLRYRGPLTDAVQTPGMLSHIEYASRALEAVIGHIEPVTTPEPSDFIGCPIQ